MSVYKRMTEWTSLSVTEEQKRQIEAAQEDAGHDGAIGRFIVQQVTSETTNDTMNVAPVEEVIHGATCDLAQSESIGDIMDKLNTIESAAKEATQAAQSAEQSVEELQR